MYLADIMHVYSSFSIECFKIGILFCPAIVSFYMTVLIFSQLCFMCKFKINQLLYAALSSNVGYTSTPRLNNISYNIAMHLSQSWSSHRLFWQNILFAPISVSVGIDSGDGGFLAHVLLHSSHQTTTHWYVGFQCSVRIYMYLYTV